MEKLRLVRPEKKHEEQAMEYLEEFYADNSETHGVGGLERYKDDYTGWLQHLEEMRNLEPNDKLVPSETFFLMKRLPRESHMLQEDVEQLVGMVNIRLVLNDNLWEYGGHIGYSIRPSERRKGYNKVNLYLALKVCQNHGIEVVLLDCDKNNVGSAKTMRALGGRLLREHTRQVPFKGKINILSYSVDVDTAFKGMFIYRSQIIQQYVIDVDNALEKYADQYDQFVSEYPN